MNTFRLNADVSLDTKKNLLLLQDYYLFKSGKRKPSLGDVVDIAIEKHVRDLRESLNEFSQANE